MRAAVEGVALELSTVLDALQPLGAVSSVRATGGVFRSRLWRDIVAAALDRPLLVTGAAEVTALGAVGLGLYALGAADSPVAGVERLGATEPTGGSAVVVADPGDVDAYRALRAGVGGL